MRKFDFLRFLVKFYVAGRGRGRGKVAEEPKLGQPEQQPSGPRGVAPPSSAGSGRGRGRGAGRGQSTSRKRFRLYFFDSKISFCVSEVISF